FVNEEALEDAELKQDKFWNDFQQIVSDFTPRNEELLKERQNIQDKIDAWHKENKNFDTATYKDFLKEIGYLEEEVEDYNINDTNVYEDIETKVGQQIVVLIKYVCYAI